jgi:glycosyltransferase domain-containing protein
MKTHSNLSSLTLLMPTFNRSKYAKRAINFWANTNVNLIVIDGSDYPLNSAFAKNLPTNVNYIHNHDSWIDRMLLGSSLSKTPFTMLISDDEFYLPNALNLLIDELNKNYEINSVTGLAVAFYPFANSIYFRRIYQTFKEASVSLDNPQKRVEFHMSPYAMTSLWAMNRTHIFKKNIQVAKICTSLPDPASFELGFEISNSYQGKSKVLPVVSWLRSMENSPNWNTKLIRTHIWWKDRFESNDLITTSNTVELLLKSKKDFKENIEEQILYVGLKQYTSNFDLNEKSIVNNHFIRKLFKKILPYRQYFFFIWFIILVFKNLNLTTWLTKKTLLDQLKFEKINISTNDLNYINKFIRSQ